MSTAAVVAPPLAVLPRAHRLAEKAVDALLVAVTLLVLSALVLRAAGVVPLVDRTDSMRPAIAAGDVVLARSVAAGALRPGQIATIPDPGLGGRLVTHRVRAVRRTGGRVVLFTRGDASTAGERWVLRADAPVRRVVGRVPRVGRAVIWLGSSALRSLLLLAAAVAFGVSGLRALRGGR